MKASGPHTLNSARCGDPQLCRICFSSRSRTWIRGTQGFLGLPGTGTRQSQPGANRNPTPKTRTPGETVPGSGIPGPQHQHHHHHHHHPSPHPNPRTEFKDKCKSKVACAESREMAKTLQKPMRNATHTGKHRKKRCETDS